MEEMKYRHRDEKKALQGKIQELKHSIPKNDKKKKKELAITISQMEAELEKRHHKEIAELKNSQEAVLADAVVELKIDQPQPSDDAEVQKPGKVSKAQRRREKKTENEKRRNEEIAHQDILNLSGARNTEIVKLNEILCEKNLNIYEIPSDGNCLYAAMEHQLLLKDIQLSVKSLREKTAEYMRSHLQDFIPFLSKPDTGDPFSEEEYINYCDEVASTNAWGGQLEMQALCENLKCSIEVYQAEGPVVTIAEKFKDENLTCKLSFHRHIYGLGEHYNSLVPVTTADRKPE